MPEAKRPAPKKRKSTSKKKRGSVWTKEIPGVRFVGKIFWIAFFCFIIGLPLYILSVESNWFVGLYGPMPDTREVENPTNDLSSELISADGVSLGRYFRYNRSQVAYEDLSQDLRNTLVISEDHRFFEHSGLDFPAFIRVMLGLITLHPAGGGSTITQQLAKNLFTLNPEHSLDGWIASWGSRPARFIQKTKEWILSVKLEEEFTKEEIIAMYLNTAPFSSNAYGIKVAAETYFNKEPDSLNLQESSMLVGMLQSPSAFNPKSNPKKAIGKRNEVLDKVFRHGYKIKNFYQLDSIRALPVELNFSVQNQNTKTAAYFRTVTGNWLMEYCKERGIDLWNSGLKIYTTIDSRMQRYAEEAMAEHMKGLQASFTSEWAQQRRNPWIDTDHKEIEDFLMKRIKQTDAYRIYERKYGANSDSLKIMLRYKKHMTIFTWKGERDTLFSSLDSLNYYKRFLQSGMMAMDPITGYVRAWVGGINHKYFKYDHVKQGTRQPGSTFKPFVYGYAMESGYSPCAPMRDISPSFKMLDGTIYRPRNFAGDLGSGEVMNIRQAMARSVNTIAAQLIQTLKPENVVTFAHDAGIVSELDAVPTLCLGVSDVSLYELVGAYSTFVNSGAHTIPMFITRIEDRNGNVIENFIPKRIERISEQTAYKVLYLLRGGVEEAGGTSSGLPFSLRENNEIGGKTGTTADASDGWYMGVTHDLVTGVWVGGDERQIHFPSWGFGQGGRTALPIWEKFMIKVYNDPSTGITKGQFKRPSSGLDITLDCNRHTSGPKHKPFSITN